MDAESSCPGPRPGEYARFLASIKERILGARLRAAASLNEAMLRLYWEIGKALAERQEKAGWGDGIIERLSKDLRQAFPEMRGFSRTNLFSMRQWYVAFRGEGRNCPESAGQIPWHHNLLIINRIKDRRRRLWYLQQTSRHGWSKRVLEHQIDSRLYERQTSPAKTHNFDRTLPPPQSDLARQMLKDPHHLDFLGLAPEARERDLEQALVVHLQEFLLELGVGFAFLGRQYRLEVGSRDYFIDLLFYHLRLRSLVSFDLKTEEFQPEDAGKMNFYLSALDDLVRPPEGRPSIGIILCRTKDRTTVEYALRDTTKPIGVSAYRLTSSLPEELRGALPTLEDLEQGLGDPGRRLP
jgi:predicted nuclease of restriction endonuclease-like (RecB) superfamily